MKVLGVSFGRKNKNCDVVTKQALTGIMEVCPEAQVEFINTVNLNITHCTGCSACGPRKEKHGNPLCVINDDFPFLANAIIDADVLIIAAPVYVLGPVGQYKNLADRMGPALDRAFLTKENERRAELKMESLDPRYFKDRVVGLISVGGARTENWTSFGLSGMHLLTFPMQMTVVDQYNLYGMGDRVHPAFDEALMARIFQMGKNVVSQFGVPKLEAKFFGDEGICPICHCDILTIRGTTTVECPVCGTYGTLKVDGENVKTEFPQNEFERARLRYGGLLEHCEEIKSFIPPLIAKMQKDGHLIEGLLAHQKSIVELKKGS